MFKFESAIFTFKFDKQLLPSPFSHYFSKSNTKHHQLTREAKSDNYFLPFYRTNKLQNSIKYHEPKFWNLLPIELKLCKSLKSFKIKLKEFFLNKYSINSPSLYPPFTYLCYICHCMYLHCIDFHRRGSLLFLKCNDLLQRDLGIKPIISNFVELLPKFGYFFF